MTITLNREQRLYVIQAGTGFTCLGFDVAFERLVKLHNELSKMVAKPLPQLPKYKGTMKVYHQLRKLQGIAHKIYNEHKIQLKCELTEQLIGLEGKRVEVVDCDGNTRRFIVGKSTGWIPCHLEIAKRNSSGGMAVYGAPFKSVRVVG